MKTDYNSLGRSICTRTHITELDPTDKVRLFRDLGEDLGVWNRLHSEGLIVAMQTITEQLGEATRDE